MRTVAILLMAVFAAGRAQAESAEDPIAQLRICSGMASADRIECLDRLARELATEAEPPATSGWTVSETTSPVDYAPIVIATVSSREAEGAAPMHLVARCRNGRTELVVTGITISGRGADYAMSYRVSGRQPVSTAASALSATEVGFPGDVVQLLQSLPTSGDIAITLSSRTGRPQQARFPLEGLERASEKIAKACKWPRLFAEPHQ